MGRSKVTSTSSYSTSTRRWDSDGESSTDDGRYQSLGRERERDDYPVREREVDDLVAMDTCRTLFVCYYPVSAECSQLAAAETDIAVSRHAPFLGLSPAINTLDNINNNYYYIIATPPQTQ